MSCSGEGSGEEEQDTVSVVFGICLGIAGSFGINIGNNLQAMGLSLKQVGEHSSQANPPPSNGKGNVIFAIGTVIFLMASVLNFVAFAFAPASILAPLESLQFVSNLGFGKFINKVEVSRRMVLGCCAVITGTSLAVALGPSDVFKFSIPILVDFWTSLPWIIYLISIMSVAAVAFFINHLYTRWVAQGLRPPYSEKVLPVTFALTSALIGTQSVVQAKSLSEVIEQLGCGVSIFSYYYTTIALILFLTQVSVWLYRLTAALALYDPLFIIPLLQSNYILFATISGGIYFQEFKTMVDYQWAGFATGCCVMFVGLYFMAPVAVEPDVGTPETGGDETPDTPETERLSHASTLMSTNSKRQITFPIVEIHQRISRAGSDISDGSIWSSRRSSHRTSRRPSFDDLPIGGVHTVPMRSVFMRNGVSPPLRGSGRTERCSPHPFTREQGKMSQQNPSIESPLNREVATPDGFALSLGIRDHPLNSSSFESECSEPLSSPPLPSTSHLTSRSHCPSRLEPASHHSRGQGPSGGFSIHCQCRMAHSDRSTSAPPHGGWGRPSSSVDMSQQVGLRVQRSHDSLVLGLAARPNPVSPGSTGPSELCDATTNGLQGRRRRQRLLVPRISIRSTRRSKVATVRQLKSFKSSDSLPL